MRSAWLGLAILAWADSAGAQPAIGAAEIDPDIAALHVGITTYANVVQSLGAPGATQARPDGGFDAGYVLTWTKVDKASFTPLVGALVGHSVSRTQSYSLRFDAAGMLRGVTAAPISVDCHDSAFHQTCENAPGGQFRSPP